MIEVLHFIPKLNSSLIELLEGLSSAQWNNPTICNKWTVKDIAAHLLDTALRRISAGRDAHFAETPTINSSSELLTFINNLNNDWVNAYKRISPDVLIKQLSAAQDEFYEYLQSVDLNSPALFPVSWAGEEQSTHWFDVAREYTERWHHQQQIRQAVGASSILERDLYYPFLNICMLALPFHFRDKTPSVSTSIKINIVGDAGGSWMIVRKDYQWELTESQNDADTTVYIDQNIAWLLLSKGVDIFEAEQYWQIAGDYELGFHALKMTAFVV